MNGKLRYTFQIVLCVVMVFFAGAKFIAKYSTDIFVATDQTVSQDLTTSITHGEDVTSKVQQGFIASGNYLNAIDIYFSRVDKSDDHLITYQILDDRGKEVFSNQFNLKEYNAGEWSRLDVGLKNLKVGREYYFVIQDLTSSKKLGVSLANGQFKQYTDLQLDGGSSSESLIMTLEFQTVHISTVNMMKVVMNAFIMLLILIMLCYTIFSIQGFSILKSCFKVSWVYGVYFALISLSICNPLEKSSYDVANFRRSMGAALASGHSIEHLVHNFYFAFGVFIFVFILSSIFMLKVEENTQDEKDVWKHIRSLFFIGLVDEGFRAITMVYNIQTDSNRFYPESYLLLFLIVLLLAYLYFGFKNKITLENYTKLIVVGYVFSYVLSFGVGLLWGKGRLLACIQFIYSAILVIYLKKSKSIKGLQKDYLNREVMLISPAILCSSLYIELVNILNQHHIFIKSPRMVYIVLGTICIIIIAILSYIFRNRQTKENWKLWSYAVIVLGIVCLAKQPPLQNIYEADIFETANTSILVTDFLGHGIIPIVEHYGGHMMAGVIENIVYAILNQDITGAALGVYTGYMNVMLAFIFFLLMRFIVNDEMALLSTIIMPFQSLWEYYAMGIVVVLAVANYIHRRNKKSILILCFMCVIATLYRLDIGVSFILAMAVSILVYAVIYRDTKVIKEGIISAGCTILVSCFLWCILCILKGINPFIRLVEFAAVSASNVNWAHGNLGGSSETMFPWSYIIFPIIVIIVLLYTILTKKFRENLSRELWLILIVLGFSYLFNFSRALVRHTAIEKQMTVIAWTGCLFIAIFLSCLLKDRKSIFLFLGIEVIINTLIPSPAIFQGQSFLEMLSSNISDIVDSWSNKREVADGKTWRQLAEERQKVHRALEDYELEQRVGDYQYLLDRILKDGQTFLDYSNRSLLYSLLEKFDPVYVSQSPMQISNEFLQKQFVSEIDQNSQYVPVAILPLKNDASAVELDGIPNVYRYYKISEYVYTHYKPIYSLGEVALWCRNDCYDEIKEIFSKNSTETEGIKNLSVLLGTKVTDEGVKLPEGNEISGLERVLNLQNLDNVELDISVGYRAEEKGTAKLYYTAESEKSGKKVSEYKMIEGEDDGNGKVHFVLSVIKNPRLSLKFENATAVTLTSLSIRPNIKHIDWGYDGNKIKDGLVTYKEDLHDYDIRELPWVWANLDEKQAVKNPVLSVARNTGNGLYLFDPVDIQDKLKGNYLYMEANYLGQNSEKLYKNNDEIAPVRVCLGIFEDGVFTEKYRYNIWLKEGLTKNLLRISTDYYWYTDKINAIKIDKGSLSVSNLNFKILAGD